MESVECNGHKHGAHAIYGAEWAIQQTGTVLVDTRIYNNHVPDDLDNKTRDAGNHEDPEEVEEIQLDIAFARGIKTQCSIFGLRSPFKFMQATLQPAFLVKSWV